jgi:cytoskeletal protein CcmA (bactofilin family)
VWNKRNDEGYAPRPQAEPNPGYAPPPSQAASQPAPPRPQAAPPAARQSAAIGPSMHIKGEISSREELLVDGEVEGSLESHSLLTVGPNGKVQANIKAREVVIYGSVRGNVEVAEKIAIREQGSLVGDIKAAGISIDDGAYFKGSIDIMRPEPKVNSKPVKSEPRNEPAPAPVAGGR